MRLALLLLALPTLASAQAPISNETAQKLAQGTFREYLEFLSLPSDAINAADIQKNADWLDLQRLIEIKGVVTLKLK